MNLRDPLFYFLTVMLGAIVVASLGPFFDEAHDTHEFLTTVGTFIGGVFTPIAILFAFRMHREAIDRPIREARTLANDNILIEIHRLPQVIGIALSTVYMNMPLLKLEDCENVRRSQGLLATLQEHLALTHSRLLDFESVIGQLDPFRRSRTMQALRTLGIYLNFEDDRDGRLDSLLLKLGLAERCLTDVLACLDTLQPLTVDDDAVVVLPNVSFETIATMRSTIRELPNVIAAGGLPEISNARPFNNPQANHDDTPS